MGHERTTISLSALNFSQSATTVTNSSLLLAKGSKRFICAFETNVETSRCFLFFLWRSNFEHFNLPPDQIIIKLWCEQWSARFASLYSPMSGACAVEAFFFSAGVHWCGWLLVYLVWLQNRGPFCSSSEI